MSADYIEVIPRKVRPKKRRPVSLWREQKQERHTTVGGVGKVGRLFRRPAR